MKHGQHITAQFRICLKYVPIHRSLAGSNGLFQLAPMLPFRIMEHKQVPDVLSGLPDKVVRRRAGIAVARALLAEEPQRDQRVQEQGERGYIGADTVCNLMSGERLLAECGKYVELDGG